MVEINNWIAVPLIGVVALGAIMVGASAFSQSTPARPKTFAQMSDKEAIAHLGERAPEACGGKYLNSLVFEAILQSPSYRNNIPDEYAERWTRLRDACEEKQAIKAGYERGKRIGRQLDRLQRGGE